MALIEADQGHWTEAEHHARQATALAGSEYAIALGQILAKTGKYAEARGWLTRALEVNPNDAAALVCLGAVLGDEGQLHEALICVDKALKIRPDLQQAITIRDQIRSVERFLKAVSATYAEFAARNGLDQDPEKLGQSEIEFPAALTNADGSPRFKMWIPGSLILNDLGAAHVFYYEVECRGYELTLQRFLDSHLVSDDVFIDVGAHWGVHSLTAATRWPHQVTVVVLEPHPENSGRLRTWVDRNKLADDVTVISAAAGNREGTAQLSVDGSSMGHSLRARHNEGKEIHTIGVDVITLDQLPVKYPNLRWRRAIIKLVVEGHELEVLSGARQLLSSGNVGAVMWENGDFYESAVQAQRTEAIIGLLNSHGFKHFRMSQVQQDLRLAPLESDVFFGDIFSVAPDFERRERCT